MLRFSLTTAIMIASSLILGDQLTRLVVAVAIAFAVLPIWKAVSEHHYQRGVHQGYQAAWEDAKRKAYDEAASFVDDLCYEVEPPRPEGLHRSRGETPPVERL